jgi:hypothetical protein
MPATEPGVGPVPLCAGWGRCGLRARLPGERYLVVPIDRERHAADLKAAPFAGNDAQLC